ERAAALGRLSAPPEPLHLPHPPPGAHGHPGHPGGRGFVRLPLLSDFERTLKDQVRSALGPAYAVEVSATPEPAPPAIAVPVPFFEAHELAAHQGNARPYDVSVRLPDREALSLFRGIEDGEPPAALDLNALLEKVREEFTDMGQQVTVAGRTVQPLTAKPQALKRCLTNLVANATTFGARADILVEDGPVVAIRVRDRGPGIPAQELERVFEPFYRLESSRNRDSGGTGLGLSIARDIAQAHGGSLSLSNLPGGGLEAALLLPRERCGAMACTAFDARLIVSAGSPSHSLTIAHGYRRRRPVTVATAVRCSHRRA